MVSEVVMKDHTGGMRNLKAPTSVVGTADHNVYQHFVPGQRHAVMITFRKVMGLEYYLNYN